MIGAYYPTKKALQESTGKALKYTETSIFGNEYRATGTFCVVGLVPGRPTKRNWFAEVTMLDGVIKAVR